MECDVILEIGGKESFTIEKGKSSKELSSLQDVAEYLSTIPKQESKQLLLNLQTSSTRIDNSLKYFLDKLLIGNCSFENLKIKFPNETELLKDIDKPYVITLVDKAYSNGEMLKGRVVVNGVVSYVFRNKFDVLNFAETEYKKHLVELIIKDDDILDDYLSEKYKDKLNIIKNNYKNNLERITREVDPNPSDKFTIKHLILDYLNNVSSYDKFIKNGDQIIDSGSVLNDFCRELNKQLIINEDSESDLARYLRRIHWKREELGKSDLYEGLATYIPGFSDKINKKLFIELSSDEMEELLQECFKDDIILSLYHVKSVERTIPTETRIKVPQRNELFKKVLELKNTERRIQGEVELSNKYKDNIKSLKDAQEFFQGYLNVEVDGEIYPLVISEDKGNIIYSYYKKELSNENKVYLEKKGKFLKDEFNFGQDTMNIFTPVNEDGIKDGYYNGYYIYNHINENKDNIFIISTSVISPNLYNPPRFKSLKDAKLAVDGFNRSANVSNYTKIELKKMGTDGKRRVNLGFSSNLGQTIESINYPISSTTKLFTAEHDLITNKKPAEIQAFYKLLGIDISTLTLPEQIGIFIYAMTEKGYSINAQKVLTEEDYEVINKIISDIIEKTKERKLYLVERYYKDNSEKGDDKYVTYIKSLTDSGITVNSTGVDINGNPPTKSLTATLYNLKTTLENTLFRDTPIKISITDNDLLKELEDDKGNKIFSDGVEHINAFIYDNTLYINLSNARLDDLIHETFHILLGAIKALDMVKGTNNYNNIIDYFYKKNKIPKSTLIKVNNLYGNLAMIDKMEECVVRYLAREVNNGNIFYYSDKTDEAIKLFREQFLNLQKNIRKALELDVDNDNTFATNISTLISNNAKQMLINRVVSNLIEQGIEKGIILEECK